MPKYTKPMTLAAIRKCVYPYPVYEAHVRDGSRTMVYRMSFWTPGGKPIDPAQGRIMFEGAYARPGELIDGFVEHDAAGLPLMRRQDPFFNGATKVQHTKPRVTVKQIKSVLADLLDAFEGELDWPTYQDKIKMAREMIAA